MRSGPHHLFFYIVCMYCFRLLFLGSIIFITGCSSTNKSGIQWYKGNLHTHSYWSDGDEFPEVVMDWYKSKGYDFVALSDHNILAEGDKWITIGENEIYQQAFTNYLSNYGRRWVNYKEDSGRITVKLKTLEEYRGRYEEPGKFLIIKSEEITDQYDRKPIHLNATNVQELIKPQRGNSVADVLQNNIDAVLRQREATGVPMIPHINHPNYYYTITVADMISLRGERFFEVFNGHPTVHVMGDADHMSTEEMWDMINIAYLTSGKPMMYGLATDDSHHYHIQGRTWSKAGRGWIVVRSDTLSAASLISALEAGEFYASTGVELKDYTVNKNELSIEVKKRPGVSYKITFIGCKKGEVAAEELKVVEGDQASFSITDDLLFVRCKVTSSKLPENPSEYELYETAWTQPVIKK